ncbi:EspA/EspE family type VII secretion system effector [Mycobacterium sp. GA-1841]|uniref:EspA/EspE family type VII secretion system effector n=1 Tax=Mycobacterium sp. GA-1841 TaxID=1834154 RepID=UPI0020C9A01C|nr:EspA/EspE family type VII secretion system effector [Mycobacterium sp. GA-1841]
MGSFNVLNALYMDSNYLYGTADHANGLSSSVPWGMAGIASDFTGIMQTVASFGPAKFAAAAATPIINGGLIALTVASNTLGFGRPEDGERFGRGATAFDDAHSSLLNAASPSGWEGDASDAYGARTAEQQNRAQNMAIQDRAIQTVLFNEADQVSKARDFVSKRQTALALCVPAAIAIKFMGPTGPAASLAFEVASVLATVPYAMDRVENTVYEAKANASQIENIARHYDDVSSTAEIPGGFGPPPPR